MPLAPSAGTSTVGAAATPLKGSTYTTFNWNTLTTGSRLYRLQYSADLRIPQAEIEFEQLLTFLLDRGAVPDKKGLRMLTVSGLWTPAGTSLMLSPDGAQSVLRISVPDDSDGVLSLAVCWRGEWDRRDVGSSLPPGWMRLEVGGLGEGREITEGGKGEGEEEAEAEIRVHERVTNGQESFLSIDSEKSGPEVSIEQVSPAKQPYLPTPTSLRFHLDSLPSNARAGGSNALTISAATWEASHTPLPSSPSLTHLRSGPALTWFPSIALSLGLSKSLPLYIHSLPQSLYSLALKDTIPCGVLVLLGLLDQSEAPDWETKYDPAEDSRSHHHNFLARQRSIASERMMTGENARIARIARESEELHRTGEEFRARLARQREREDKREREAFASGRLPAKVVAEAGIKWLIHEKLLNEGAGTQDAVEGLLMGMITQEQVAIGVFSVLERWQEWSDRGGMNTEDLTIFKKNKVGFCYAACVMGLLRDVCIKEESSVAVDMQECIRFWKKVRLG